VSTIMKMLKVYGMVRVVFKWDMPEDANCHRQVAVCCQVVSATAATVSTSHSSKRTERPLQSVGRDVKSYADLQQWFGI
jgi:hypothetical protein